jgi:hypothetical protein
MKKALWIIATVVAVLALATVPTLAGGDKHRHRWRGARFALVGEVTAVDAETLTITVQVEKGSKPVRPHVGEALTVATGERTRFLRHGERPPEVIGFQDVEVGARVGINGVVKPDDEGNRVFLAWRVVVDVPERVPPPAPE